MEDLLTCQICFARFGDLDHTPKVLPCGHTYCVSCISKISGPARMSCPYCTRTHRFKNPDFIHTLPTNFYVLGFIREVEEIVAGSSSTKQICLGCLKGVDVNQLRECHTCKKKPVLCDTCAKDKHPGHVIKDFDIDQKKKKNLKRCREKCQEEIGAASKALEKTRKTVENLQKEADTAVTDEDRDAEQRLLALRMQARTLAMSLSVFNEEAESKETFTRKYEHRNITCDVCERHPIIGHRFICSECDDFDICEDCERRGEHSQHILLRVVNERTSRSTEWLVKLAPNHEDQARKMRAVIATFKDSKFRLMELARQAKQPEDELLYLQLAEETPNGLLWPERCDLLDSYRKVARNAVQRARYMHRYHEKERLCLLGVDYGRKLLDDATLPKKEQVIVSRLLGKLLSYIHEVQEKFEDVYGSKTRTEDYMQLTVDMYKEGYLFAKEIMGPIDVERLHLIKNFVHYLMDINSVSMASQYVTEELAVVDKALAKAKKSADIDKEVERLVQRLHNFKKNLNRAQHEFGEDLDEEPTTDDDEDTENELDAAMEVVAAMNDDDDEDDEDDDPDYEAGDDPW